MWLLHDPFDTPVEADWGPWSMQAHFVCKNQLNLWVVDKGDALYDSGFWDIPEDDARKLVGGSIHLHEAKSKVSYFGGTVLKYRVELYPAEHAKRVVFTLRSTKEGRGVRWSGRTEARAWYSGVV